MATITDNAQVEANELEGIVTADQATLELIDQLRTIKRRKAEVEAEEKLVSGLIKDQMNKNGVRHYLDSDGVEITTLSERATSRFDKKAAIAKLGVEVVGEFYSSSSSFVLTLKN